MLLAPVSSITRVMGHYVSRTVEDQPPDQRQKWVSLHKMVQSLHTDLQATFRCSDQKFQKVVYKIKMLKKVLKSAMKDQLAQPDDLKALKTRITEEILRLETDTNLEREYSYEGREDYDKEWQNLYDCREEKNGEERINEGDDTDAHSKDSDDAHSKDSDDAHSKDSDDAHSKEGAEQHSQDSDLEEHAKNSDNSEHVSMTASEPASEDRSCKLQSTYMLNDLRDMELLTDAVLHLSTSVYREYGELVVGKATLRDRLRRLQISLEYIRAARAKFAEQDANATAIMRDIQDAFKYFLFVNILDPDLSFFHRFVAVIDQLQEVVESSGDLPQMPPPQHRNLSLSTVLEQDLINLSSVNPSLVNAVPLLNLLLERYLIFQEDDTESEISGGPSMIVKISINLNSSSTSSESDDTGRGDADGALTLRKGAQWLVGLQKTQEKLCCLREEIKEQNSLMKECLLLKTEES
nr:uncharacterized protein LOC123770630 [Procambarus clarkii]